MKIDPDTGEAAAPGDANAIFEFFLAENAPKVPSANDANARTRSKPWTYFAAAGKYSVCLKMTEY